MDSIPSEVDLNNDLATRLANINKGLAGSFASLGVGSQAGPSNPAVNSLYDRFIKNGGSPLPTLPGFGSGDKSTGNTGGTKPTDKSTDKSTGSEGDNSNTSVLDSIFGLSLSRISAIVLGLICIAGAIYLFKPAQEVINSTVKTGARAAALIP